MTFLVYSRYSESDHDCLTAPVGPVYFAGEACSAKYYGYIHGALISGKETAQQIISNISAPKHCL